MSGTRALAMILLIWALGAGCAAAQATGDEAAPSSDAPAGAAGVADAPSGSAAGPSSVFDDGNYTCPSGRVLPPPALRSSSVIVFEPYGPAPDTDEAQLAAWTGLLRERYYGDIGQERADAIDAELDRLHIVDLTPAFMNLCIGLDMASAEDVGLIGDLNLDWYNRQYGYQAVIIDADPDDLRPQRVESRLLVIDGWCRWWARTSADPAKVARYRKRLDELDFELKRIGRDRPVRVRAKGGSVPR